CLSLSFYSLLIHPPSRSTLFPYTTLFRSRGTISMPVNVTGSSVSSVTYSIDSRSPVDFTGNNSLTINTKALRDGPHTFTVTATRSEEHTSELQSLAYLVCRLLLEKKKTKQ